MSISENEKFRKTITDKFKDRIYELVIPGSIMAYVKTVALSMCYLNMGVMGTSQLWYIDKKGLCEDK